MSDTITFHASFPAIQSAIKVTGTGDGMRIQFDIPESEMPAALGLLAFRQMMMRITVDPVSERQNA